MQQFLIEVPHPEETLACARFVKVFLSTGSHFLTHAHWGCMDGVHSAWLMVEAANKEEARHSDPDLAYPLRHYASHHTINPHCRQDQRHCSEHCEPRCANRALAVPSRMRSYMVLM